MRKKGNKDGVVIKLDADTTRMERIVVGKNTMPVIYNKAGRLLNRKGNKGTGNSEYDNRFHPVMAFRVCREMGATEKELSAIFNICIATIRKWTRIHPRFAKAVRMGLDIFNSEKVEISVLERALGGTKINKKEFRKTRVVIDPETKRPMIDPTTRTAVTYDEVTSSVEEVYVPPDIKACMFWLTHRSDKRWPANPVTRIAAKVTEDHKHLHVDFANCTDDELRNLKQITEKATKNGREVTPPHSVTEEQYAQLSKEDPEMLDEILQQTVADATDEERVLEYGDE